MPRIRTIKPEALQHRKVGRLSHVAFRLWVGMITQADDHGRGPADQGQLRLLVFGYHDDVTEAKVADALQEIAGLGLIRLYEVAGTPYYLFPDWAAHQKISHPARPLYPSPPESSGGDQSPPEPSRTFHGDRKDWKEGSRKERPDDSGPSSLSESNGTTQGLDHIGGPLEATMKRIGQKFAGTG